MNRGDPLGKVLRAMYGVAAILVLAPLMDLSTRVWPVHPGSPNWRFGTSGLFASALLLPLLGLAVALGTAAALRHRRTLRVLSLGAYVAAIGMLFGAGLFALDFLQLRGNVEPTMLGRYDVASVKAGVLLLLAVVVTAWLGAGGWRAARAVSRRDAVSGRSGRVGVLVKSSAREEAS